MAEGLLHHLHGDRYEVESAGTEPTEANPLAVRAMAERGRRISLLLRPHVTDPLRRGIVGLDDDRLREAVEEPLARPWHRDPPYEAVQGEEEGLPEALDGGLGKIDLLASHVGDFEVQGHFSEGLAPIPFHQRPVDEEDQGVIRAEVDKPVVEERAMEAEDAKRPGKACDAHQNIPQYPHQD